MSNFKYRQSLTCTASCIAYSPHKKQKQEAKIAQGR
jgi:hypothetical protein